MNSRTTVVLLILNCLVALGLFLTRDSDVEGGRRKLLPEDFDLQAVTSIQFSAGKAWPRFLLTRDEKERWHIGGVDGPLANQNACVDILDRLGRAPILPFETGGEKDLGLNPPLRTLTLFSQEGRKRVIELGSVHPMALGIFARIQGEEEIHLTDRGVAGLLGLQPGTLRELRPFPFSPLEIKRFRLVRRTLSGEEVIDADRNWLVWFLRKPQIVRGTQRLDDMISVLLGVRRSSLRKVPGQVPALEATLHTSTATVTLDFWKIQDQEDVWIASVRGEEDGFTVVNPSLIALLAPFRQLWNHGIIHDSSSQLSRLRWKRSGQKAIVLARDPTNWEQWRIEAPRKAQGDRAVIEQVTQDLVRFQVDDMAPSGMDRKSAGLDSPHLDLSLEFRTGAGRMKFLVSHPRDRVAHLVQVKGSKEEEETGPIFLVKAVSLDVLPHTVLPLLDRTVYNGDWKVVSSLLVQRGQDRFQLRNVGIDEKRHWQRTDVSGDVQPEDGYVSGTQMRILLTHLLAFRADRVIAWNTKEADPEWGIDHPALVLTFKDTASAGNKTIKIAIGKAQTERRRGLVWYPVWHIGEGALPDHGFVYRISQELVKKIQAVLP